MRGLKKNKCLPGILLGIVFILLTPFNLLAADVDVYAEGAYTETDLVLYIYADINSESILSFGVKVEYPAGLTFGSATKNEAVWFFGDGSTNYPYMGPEDDGSGVVIIGGKLDTGDPTAGVTGTRVLLGTVTFTHTGMTDFSGVTLTYGRGDGTGDYKNFVSTAGTVYDSADSTGVSFTTEIHQRGDANGDGAINVADMSAVRYVIVNGGNIYPWLDCNGDGNVNVADMSCVRYIITN